MYLNEAQASVLENYEDGRFSHLKSKPFLSNQDIDSLDIGARLMLEALQSLPLKPTYRETALSFCRLQSEVDAALLVLEEVERQIQQRINTEPPNTDYAQSKL